MKYLFALALFILQNYCNAQMPTAAEGTIKRFENFSSAFVSTRNVDVWLPNNYSAKNKYAVLYMHDGQMLFDSTITWNKQEWKVDEVAQKLINEKKVQPFIVVGIWNSGKTRHADYFPQKALKYLHDTIKTKLVQNNLSNNPQADNYLKFLVYELKPFIDSAFSTYTDKQHTFIAGSSMGGLISFYAFCEYSNVFGGAACMSTHWVGSLLFSKGEIPTAFCKYALYNLPKANAGKLYFDYGTATLDSLYKPHQKAIDKIVKKKGFTDIFFTTLEFTEAAHTENDWAKRLHLPFIFLLKPKK